MELEDLKGKKLFKVNVSLEYDEDYIVVADSLDEIDEDTFSQDIDYDSALNVHITELDLSKNRDDVMAKYWLGQPLYDIDGDHLGLDVSDVYETLFVAKLQKEYLEKNNYKLFDEINP
jgi:hypothetical protein